MSEEIKRELFVPNTAVEALAMLEAEFPDVIQREALEGLWDYGHEAGIQVAIDYLRKVINAEAINEEDENMLD